jgi:hypothetical protein
VQPKHRRRPGRIAGLIVYAAFVFATIAWFALYQFPRSPVEEAGNSAPDEPTRVGRVTGSILIPGGADGGCRQMKFDNDTGSIRKAADAACGDNASGANSTEGRMNAIRGAFTKR